MYKMYMKPFVDYIKYIFNINDNNSNKLVIYTIDDSMKIVNNNKYISIENNKILTIPPNQSIKLNTKIQYLILNYDDNKLYIIYPSYYLSENNINLKISYLISNKLNDIILYITNNSNETIKIDPGKNLANIIQHTIEPINIDIINHNFDNELK